ncbi:tyrosine-protein phosphatase [soil metagenome]
MGDLSWSGCDNVRDLGGLPVAGGGSTRERALVRADSLTRLHGAGVRAARGYGVVRVVDLRAGTETGARSHPFEADEGYRRVPWIDVDREPERDPSAERDLADLYCGSLDRNVRQVAAAGRAVTTAPAGPVVVHCAAGKDRTGMLVALLLETAGVTREAVVADYAVSSERLVVAERLATLGEEERAAAETYAWSRPETLTTALEHLDTAYGGAPAYLRDACGLSDEELADVRRRLTG